MTQGPCVCPSNASTVVHENIMLAVQNGKRFVKCVLCQEANCQATRKNRG